MSDGLDNVFTGGLPIPRHLQGGPAAPVAAAPGQRIKRNYTRRAKQESPPLGGGDSGCETGGVDTFEAWHPANPEGDSGCETGGG